MEKGAREIIREQEEKLKWSREQREMKKEQQKLVKRSESKKYRREQGAGVKGLKLGNPIDPSNLFFMVDGLVPICQQFGSPEAYHVGRCWIGSSACQFCRQFMVPSVFLTHRQCMGRQLFVRPPSALTCRPHR